MTSRNPPDPRRPAAAGRLAVLLCVLCATLLPPTLLAADAKALYEGLADRIYQVRILARSSQNKTSLGSAFQVRPDGLLVTNYHVVSDAVTYPDAYQAQYVARDGSSGRLTVVDVDVINDLALVRREGRGPYIPLAPAMPAQGEQIYSLGNPLDLGSAVVPGTYNGITDHSYYQRIHFTGALNPGMSGGPVVNDDGALVGVNVATAGNEVGFLVHLDKVRALLARHDAGDGAGVDLRERIRKQLTDNQQALLTDILAADWPSHEMGDTRVPSDIKPYLQCWGRTNDKNEEARFVRIVRRCQTSEQIFLSGSHQTGQMYFEYIWLDGTELNALQHAKLVESVFNSARPGNRAGRRDVGEFDCHEGFIRGAGKAVLCARPYKRYAGLYDVLFIAAEVRPGRKALMSHFTLAGVTRDNALAFAGKFIGAQQWN